MMINAWAWNIEDGKSIIAFELYQYSRQYTDQVRCEERSGIKMNDIGNHIVGIVAEEYTYIVG